MRDTDGNRVTSSMVKMSGRSTNPCTISRCSDGSIVGTPRMVALIMQAVRGDDSVQVLERRQAERRQARRRLGQALAITAHDIGFKFGWPPIRLAQRLLAGLELPFRDRRRQVVALLRQGRTGNDRRRRACARAEQAPSGEAPFVSISWLGRGRGRLRRFRTSAGSSVYSLPLRPPTGGRCVQSSPRSPGQTRAWTRVHCPQWRATKRAP